MEFENYSSKSSLNANGSSKLRSRAGETFIFMWKKKLVFRRNVNFHKDARNKNSGKLVFSTEHFDSADFFARTIWALLAFKNIHREFV